MDERIEAIFASLVTSGTIVVESRASDDQPPFARTVIQLDGDVITTISRATLDDPRLAEKHSAAVAEQLAKLEHDWPFARVREWLRNLQVLAVIAALVTAIVGFFLQKKVPEAKLPKILAYVTSAALAVGGWIARWLHGGAVHRWIAAVRRRAP